MSKLVRKSILVRPDAAPTASIEAEYGDILQLARFTGRLSGLVDDKAGLTPAQLADVVKLLDKFIGLAES